MKINLVWGWFWKKGGKGRFCIENVLQKFNQMEKFFDM